MYILRSKLYSDDNKDTTALPNLRMDIQAIIGSMFLRNTNLVSSKTLGDKY